MTKAKREAGIIAPVNNTLSLEARGLLAVKGTLVLECGKMLQKAG